MTTASNPLPTRMPPLPTHLSLALACALGLALPGCLTELTVVEMQQQDGGLAEAQDPEGAAGASPSDPKMPVSEPPPPATDQAMGSMVEPVIGAERPISAGPAAASCGAPPLVMSTRCTAEPTELLTELRDIYDLGATNTQLYAATIDGISRAAREGGTQEVFKEGNTVRLLVDEERVFWSDGSLGLNVLGQDGQSSVFLPANGAIDGVSQDADSIFAIADGYLWRVSKATQEATALVDGVHGGPPLHWSETAVDDEFVYFVSYETELSLERIRKDGTDRQVLASGLADAMQPLFLLVDDTHVYAATYYGGLLMRVPLAGGMPETLAWQHQTQWPDPVLAQDDECLYYADGATLYCLSKADCTTEILLTVGEGVITQLAKSGDDLYVGVYVDSPAVKPLSWVGAVQCPMGG